MDPAFGFNERAGEKQVHQHGLAAPHVPMHVKAPRRRAGLAAPDQELVEKATALRSPCHKIRVQAVEAAHHRLLRRVGLEVTARTQRLVSGEGTIAGKRIRGLFKTDLIYLGGDLYHKSVSKPAEISVVGQVEFAFL